MLHGNAEMRQLDEGVDFTVGMLQDERFRNNLAIRAEDGNHTFAFGNINAD